MAKELVLENREWITIKDAEGNEGGGFWWNPADLDIVKRADTVVNALENLKLPEDGDEADFYKVSDEVRKQFDYLLNTDTAALFPVNPLSPREDGTIYAEYLIDVLVKFIESELDVRIKRSNARIKKYTDKYKK